MIRNIGEQRILNVDLTQSKTWTESVPQSELLKYMGGRGIAAKLLYERIDKGADPLGADNPLIISAGTLSGTSAPSTGRTSITCKSPATHRYLKVNVGGHVGPELRYAGWDYLVISGAASEPCYLWISDGVVEIRNAGKLWGKGTRATDELLKAELGDQEIQTMVIGPAGENRVLFACVMCSHHNSAARGGVGAVFGSKKLKAVAIRGHGSLRVHHAERFQSYALQLRRKIAEDPDVDGFYQWGTAGMIQDLNETELWQARNSLDVQIEGGSDLSGQHLADHGFLIGRQSCFGCSTACHRYTRTMEHRWGKVQDTGPEYESLAALGAQCGIADTESAILANYLCNDLGMDTISAGQVVSWAMETFEKGLISEADTEGIRLNFGNSEALHTLLSQIGHRQGSFADLLANGTRYAAEKVGGDSYQWAIQAKGLEQSCVDTRSTMGYGLAFAVNPRGPDHLMAQPISEFGGSKEARAVIREITGDEKYADPTITEKKPEIVRWHEDVYAVTDALGFCIFASIGPVVVKPDDIAELLSLALDTQISVQDLMQAGRRIVTVERCFNVREGARREEDRLPWRMMNEPVSAGPTKGMVMDQATLDGLLDTYYSLHGWDTATAIPLRSTLEELGLIDLCGDVAK